MSWQKVETEVRKLAESVWGTNAVPEVEAGVKCDCILRYRDDYWVLVEISKQDTLHKIREELGKFAVLKPALMSRGIYSECHFVTSGDHSSLVESGKTLNVEVNNLKTFANKFLGSSIYMSERAREPFGSAVNPDSGKKDETTYTAIKYVGEDGQSYSVSQICEMLKHGKKIILVGEFGTGKSRCLMEVFSHLIAQESAFAPIAINLRDNWGYKRLSHVISNHMDMLGLGKFTDSLVRSLRRGNHVLLLDGIDEIGSQSWSGDAARLTEIRKLSLEGVRDIISSCSQSGILLTGREHYFGSDAEMGECLGLSSGDYLKLSCPNEFSDNEILEYIRTNTSLTGVPDWMPRKPLICQLLARLDPKEVERLDSAAHGEVEFFDSVFDAICERETRINPAIFKDVLKGILLNLAQSTRGMLLEQELISTADINQAFYDVAGYAPIDESAILLQRLPYLGRVGSGGSERIFVDAYARDGLRGLSLAKIFATSDRKVAAEKWNQPIGNFGLRVLASKIQPNDTLEKFIRYCVNHGNNQIACDYVQLRLAFDNRSENFGDLTINGGYINDLRFVNKEVKDLHLDNIHIDLLEIEDASFSNVSVRGCILERIEGVGSVDKLPNVFDDTCLYGDFKGAFTISRISELGLSQGHKTLLAIIKKLFFQPGRGRQAEALLRGAENYWDQETADAVLQYMLRNELILKVQGDHGDLYVPRRRNTRRMARVWELQSNSGDELWDLVN
jgi:hypothetical protein